MANNLSAKVYAIISANNNYINLQIENITSNFSATEKLSFEGAEFNVETLTKFLNLVSAKNLTTTEQIYIIQNFSRIKKKYSV